MLPTPLPFLRRSLRSLAPIFRPPFDGLWIVVLLYFFWCFLVHPKGQMLRGNLPDPDDYMYLDQVLDWLKGQGWYDHLQHRLDYPAGGMIHFSRLPQIPMAILISLFEWLGLPPVGAATIMAIFWPLCLLAGLFAAVRWTAKGFVPKDWVGVTPFLTLFATGLMVMFVPGHVDHHGLELVLMTITLGCLFRMLRQPEDGRGAATAGLVLALALTIALEILPWLIVISAWVGLWAIVRGRDACRSGLVFGLCLYVGSAVLLLTARTPADLLVPDVAAYSIVYVYFTGSIATVFAAIGLGSRWHAAWRWGLALGAAALAGILFLSHYPSLITGPWGGVDPSLAKLILQNVNEAAPLVKIKVTWLKTAVSVLTPLIAFMAAIYFLRHARKDEFWTWGLIAVLLLAALLLSVFYQYRFVGGLGLFQIIPLTVFLQRGWKWIGAKLRGRSRFFAELGLIFLVGPLPAVLVPALFDGRSFNTGVLLFPVHNDRGTLCDMYGLERVLRASQLYDGRPQLIINTMGIGPELLFRTPHYVLSAPYHEDVAGNLDAVRFFSTSDMKKAEAVARRRHAGLVVTCKLIPGLYADLAAVKDALPDAFAGEETSPTKPPQPPMILRLITGVQVPDWLTPVTAPDLVNYVVYEITSPSRARKFPAGE